MRKYHRSINVSVETSETDIKTNILLMTFYKNGYIFNNQKYQ